MAGNADDWRRRIRTSGGGSARRKRGKDRADHCGRAPGGICGCGDSSGTGERIKNGKNHGNNSDRKGSLS